LPGLSMYSPAQPVGENRRDLALLTLALGTGLRLRELVGLNVGHVAANGTDVAWKVELPKAITKGGRGGVAFLPRRARAELRRFLTWKRSHCEPLLQDSPLFASNRAVVSLQPAIIVLTSFGSWSAGTTRAFTWLRVRGEGMRIHGVARCHPGHPQPRVIPTCVPPREYPLVAKPLKRTATPRSNPHRERQNVPVPTQRPTSELFNLRRSEVSPSSE